ncbi:hypothetical protein H632_c271p1 [Helicosporidium sp. ATCC 50920]|nr:hypothetical protein H632_c271p1 [Helicosporidium sp. ATCC 50920]|eukprot:KDD76317.1 hypothetical protein H632_c271p1 [Helicosporidium sp. ATCC 50920]
MWHMRFVAGTEFPTYLCPRAVSLLSPSSRTPATFQVAQPLGARSAMVGLDLTLRLLREEDYEKSYLSLLSQLTETGEYDRDTWRARFAEIQARAPEYCVVVVEDPSKSLAVASATLLVELKFIRGAGKCGHIEDVVVHRDYRGHQLGRRLIDDLVQRAREQGCYKVMLDCSEDNVLFYEKCGFWKKEAQMVQYFGKGAKTPGEGAR